MSKHVGAAAIARARVRGQVTIPLEIREACGVEAGSRLFFVQSGPTSFECHVLPPKRSVMDTIAEHAGEGLAPTMRELREAMADEIAAKYVPDSVER